CLFRRLGWREPGSGFGSYLPRPTKFSELPNIFRAKAIETAFGRSFCLALWATSQSALRDCGRGRQGDSSGIHLAMHACQQYDAVTLGILRRALDEVFTPQPPRSMQRGGPAERAYFMHQLPQSAEGVAGGEASCDHCDGHWAALLGSGDYSNTLRPRVDCTCRTEGRRLQASGHYP